MTGYSLVPVDYQPDFDDVSLVPVDYDPFSTDDAIPQAQSPPASTSPAQFAAMMPYAGSASTQSTTFSPQNSVPVIPVGGTKNSLKPAEGAVGPHSSYRYSPEGEIQNYETYQQNPVTGGYDRILRYRGVGDRHGGVDPPFILEPRSGLGSTPVVPRPALPFEVPRGGPGGRGGGGRVMPVF